MTTGSPTHTESSASLAVRQRGAVLRLVRAVRDRAAEQARIDEAHTAALEAAESEHTSATRRINKEAEEAREQAEHQRDSLVKDLKKKYDAQEREAVKNHREARAAAMAELDSAQRVAEEGLRDAAWLAEATFEGGAEQPKQELERVRGVVRAEFARLDSIEVHASKLAGPRVPLPPTRPERPDVEAATEAERLAALTAGQDGNGEPPGPPLDALAERRESANRNLDRLRGPTLHAFVRAGGPIFLIVLASVGAGVGHLLTTGMGEPLLSAGYFAGVGAAVLLLMLPLRAVALAGTRRRLAPLAADLVEARRLGHLAVAMAERNKREIEEEIFQRRNTEVQAGKAKYENRLARVKMRREQILARLDRKHTMMTQEIRKRRGVAIAEAERAADEKTDEIEADRARRIAEAEAAHAEALRAAEHARETEHADLVMHWRETMGHASACLADVHEAMDRSCPPWGDPSWSGWTPPLEVPRAVRIGAFTADLAALPGGLPEEAAMMEGLEPVYEPAALLDVPERASLVVKSDADGRAGSLGVVRNAMLRVLTALPAGKARLTMMDPVGLGQSFAGFMRLADHDERLVGSRIWTEARHIEQRLADLTEHMETVIQKYLRNEFESIEAYNEKAGEIAEPYRFLVVADFPTGFTEEAARRLSSIIESGPRCGVFVLLHQDPRGKLPETITQEEIDEGCHVVEYEHSGSESAGDDGDAHAGRFVWRHEAYETLPLTLEAPPADAEVARLLDVIGRASLESGKVEVPFTVLAPEEPATWTSSCDDELRIPLGRAGATKLQHMSLGRGTSQHVLLAGKTGSGKSTLLHVMITAGALWYSPDELEFYLVDFKKGVEFKAYAGGHDHQGLPHARAIAVESDREFGLSVLHRLDEELKRRGDLFRDLGVQSIGAARAALKKAGRDEAMPRSLLVIDEFQEFFTEDDKIAQDAGLLLDRLVRQGRAFGMHVLLGSQTLSGAYSLARSTVGQMAVRIALQCSETDSYLILSEDNSAARLLNRPGEAIYNDANGMVEGNNPFQVCWLPDAERDAMLARVRTALGTHDVQRRPPPIVFEGNVPADLADNAELAAALEPGAEPTRAAKAWVGDPVEIKPPAGAVLRRQAGANLLILGQQDDTSRAMLASSLVGLAAQHAPKTANVRIAVLDSTPPDDPAADDLERITGALAGGALDVSFGRVRDAAGVLAEFDAERSRREEDDSAAHAPWYLIVHGLQRFRDLRKKEDDFSFSFSSDDDGDGGGGGSPAQHLADLLRDGPALGLHVVAWVDTATSLSRTLDRAGVGHFEQRAVLQMSVADSSNLIDSPVAGKLGMNRGLLFNEELGTLEKFRPYRLPDDELVARVAAALRR